ncbi:MAG TPA: ABC transporter permease, partial [Chitinophagaceae bacterium]|nr:ABC transporter permease [Chitinophagaceae bacterium]
MLKNYFKTALRNFWANRFFSLTNITGLAIGISASLVIYLIVNYDFSFDRFEKDGNRIYRVVSDYTFSGKSFHDSGVPHALPPAVKNEVTGLETIAPFYLWNEGVKISIPFTSNNVTDWKKQKDIVFADENYFELLQYTWLAGSPKTSLTQPYEVVLTASNVKLYFPTLTNDQVIGKEMIFSDTVRTTVTGIVKDFSQNSDFSFKTFVSRATIETPRLKRHDGNEWTSASPSSQLFVRLSAGTSTAQINNQVEGLFIKYSKKNAANVSTRHHLQPLADLHFNAAYENFNQRIAHKPTLYGLLAVAAFLLLLACINFINLTTAQASKRAKEIGIRKTMGSSKKQLIFQFLTETFLLTVAAAILSLGLTPLLLKIFADFVPDGLHFNLLHQPGVWLFLLLLLVAVSLLAGFYPAIILSSYKPVLVLKKQVSANTGTSHSIWMRKSLTVSQFVIAQVFIIATMLVGKQINYTLNKDLGFKKDAVVYFTTGISDFNPEHKAFLMDKLKAIPGIEKISISNFTPSLNGHHYPASILK